MKRNLENRANRGEKKAGTEQHEHFQRHNLLTSLALLPNKSQHDDKKVNSYLRQNNSNGQAMYNVSCH